MKVAVVFDTLHPEWDEAAFQRDLDAGADEAEYEVAQALRTKGHQVHMIGIKDDVGPLVDRLAAAAPDLVFNCCESFRGDSHLEYGVAAVLEMCGYPYTGSPPTALLVARNKSMSKKILAYHGIRVPEFATYRVGDPCVRPSTLRYPLIVKPLLEDASLGIAQASVVTDDESLQERVRFIHDSFQQGAIAEELVEGRELYVGAIGNSEIEILPIVELSFGKLSTAERRIATYKAKWDQEYRDRYGIKSRFTRRLKEPVLVRIKEICSTAFHALWLRDYARFDIRLAHDDELYVLEVNPNPFISLGHELANAAEKAGMKYEDFIQRIVDEAMGRE